MKLFYELGYRFFRMPWEAGPREELVGLVESGRIVPFQALAICCGASSGRCAGGNGSFSASPFSAPWRSIQARLNGVLVNILRSSGSPVTLIFLGLWELAWVASRSPQLVGGVAWQPPTSWGLQHCDHAKSQRAIFLDGHAGSRPT